MIDERQIVQWWQFFVERGNGVVEIRAIEGRRNWSGYFKDLNNLISKVQFLDSSTEASIYFTLNTVNEDCYDRNQCECFEMNAKTTTSDNDIVRRKFVLIDLDPKRSVGINSSDEELARAKSKARQIYNYLKQQGFNDMLLAMSGNGYHLLIPCDITITEDNNAMVKRFLQTLAWFFNGDDIEVDCSVFNPARICKLYGTVAKKGRNSQKRPRRLAVFEYVPAEIIDTPTECFRRVAGLYPEDSPKPSRENGWGRGERFDLEDFMTRHGIQYRPVSIADGTKYLLDHCPFDENHKNKDAVIFQRQNGAIGFHCFHNSCQGRTWKDVRLLFEPDAYSKQVGDSKPQLLVKTDFIHVKASERKEEYGDVWLRLGKIPVKAFTEDDYIKSGLQQIDGEMIGFRRGHISVWTGKRGCGKSSVLNELALNAANYGCKTAIWSGELDASEIQKWFFLQAAAHHTVASQKYNNFYEVPVNIIKRISEWACQYVRIYNNQYGESEGNPYSKIEKDIIKAYEDEKFDVAIMDNLMVLGIDDISADNINERQKKLMQKIHNLAMKLDIHIHLVAHPNKQQGFLRLDNVSGTGHITDMAQNVFLMHRVNEDFEKAAKDFMSVGALTDIKGSGCTNLIEIGKCRDKGMAVGKHVLLYFDVRNNQLQEGVNQTLHYGWEDEVAAPSMAQEEETRMRFDGGSGTDNMTVADEIPVDFDADAANYDENGNWIGNMPF